MTAVVTTSAASLRETGDLVEDLAEELESFAFERERVLAKLDIRAANTARRLARELRLVLRGLAVAENDEDGRDSALATLGSLLEEAHRVLDDVATHAATGSRSTAAPAARDDVSPRGDVAPDHAGADDLAAPAEPDPSSGLRAIDGAPVESGDRLTIESLPSVSHDPDDPEETEQDLTIARRVMWERSGNRILGR